MDRAGADYFAAVNSLKDRLGVPAIPVQYPLGVERGFRAVVDLMTGEALEFRDATSPLSDHPALFTRFRIR